MSSKQQENNDSQTSSRNSKVVLSHNPYQPRDSKENAIYLAELSLTLQRNWWLLLTCILIAFLGAWVYTKLTPKNYTARVAYEVSHLNPVKLQQKNGSSRVIDLEKEYLNQQTIGLFQKIEFLSFFLERTGLTTLVLEDLYDPLTDTYALPNDLLSPDEFAASSLIGDGKNPVFEFQTEQSSGLTSLTVHYRDPDLVTSLANDGLLWANDHLISQEIFNLQWQLEGLRQSLAQLGSKRLAANVTSAIGSQSSVSSAIFENLQPRLIDRQIELGVLDKAQLSDPSISPMKVEAAVLEEKLLELNNHTANQSNIFSGEAEEIAKLRIQFAQSHGRLQQLRTGDRPLVRIIDRALPPENPSRPNAPLIMGLSLVVGLFGGMFFVFAVDFVRKVR